MDEQLRQRLKNLLLALADDKLILGHRNSDWTGLGPILEEDIAFSALAQDEMAHAQAIYEYIAKMTGDDDADRLAFGRTPGEFRCAHIVEVPDEFDWATALARQFFCAHFDLLRLSRFSQSNEPKLAALAKRLLAEERGHVEHADGWVIRLGRVKGESSARMQRALDALAPLASDLFESVEGEDELVAAGVYPRPDGDMFDQWADALKHVTDEAGLQLNPQRRASDNFAGRHGKHTQHLKPLLDEMCEVYRLEPDAAW